MGNRIHQIGRGNGAADLALRLRTFPRRLPPCGHGGILPRGEAVRARYRGTAGEEKAAGAFHSSGGGAVGVWVLLRRE